jgi:nitrogen regulatory protein P-II 1
MPKIKIEVVVENDIADSVIDTIVKTARSGKIGDGKVFISTMDEAVRIRTGEKGAKAL